MACALGGFEHATPFEVSSEDPRHIIASLLKGLEPALSLSTAAKKTRDSMAFLLEVAAEDPRDPTASLLGGCELVTPLEVAVVERGEPTDVIDSDGDGEDSLILFCASKEGGAPV